MADGAAGRDLLVAALSDDVATSDSSAAADVEVMDVAPSSGAGGAGAGTGDPATTTLEDRISAAAAALSAAAAAKDEDGFPPATEQAVGYAPLCEGLEPEMVSRVDYVPPAVDWRGMSEAPRFYEWKEVFPFLAEIRRHTAEITEEMKEATRWHAWPEQALYSAEEGHDWKVFPFCHTFPARDPSSTQWLPKNVKECPKTAALLAGIPGLRTALISRLGPGTTLTAHQGWAALANHVLRVHLPLIVPPEVEGKPPCGLVVEGETSHHEEGEFIIFDDSKLHMAFNEHPTKSRVVLIFDVVRPPQLPVGLAEGSTTDELEAFIQYFSQ